MQTPTPTPPSAPSLNPRDVVDRYRVERRLGQGGMATVYRVRHLQLGSVHALKLLSGTGDVVAKRLLLEGRVQARLVHPNVVGVTDVVEVQGTPALILEYVAGPTLAEVLLVARPLTVPQIDLLAGQILRGVEMAHGLGFAHRDLKPANVLVGEALDGGPLAKVADFGLAKVLAGEGLDSTRPNVAMGTPSYMAPEQIVDARSADLRSDVFALGAILYELATGERAFAGGSVFEIFRKIGNGEAPPLRQRRPDLPERMFAAVEAALQGDPGRRPATARELRGLWREEPPDPRAFGDALAALFLAHRRDADPFTPSAEQPTPAPADRGTTMIPTSGESSAITSPRPSSRAAPPLFAAVAAIAGVVGVAALALGLLLRPLPPDPEPQRPAPIEVAPEPAPQVAEPEPATPQSPAPAAPTPRRNKVEAPASAPATAPGPAPGPSPEPAPAAPSGPPAGHGRVAVSGDARRVYFVRSGTTSRLGAGDLPAGRYRVEAVWADEPVPAGEIEVSDGGAVAVRCSASVRVCR